MVVGEENDRPTAVGVSSAAMAEERPSGPREPGRQPLDHAELRHLQARSLNSCLHKFSQDLITDTEGDFQAHPWAGFLLGSAHSMCPPEGPTDTPARSH